MSSSRCAPTIGERIVRLWVLPAISVTVLLVVGESRESTGFRPSRDDDIKTTVFRFNKPLVPERLLFLKVAGRKSRIVVCLGQEPGERFGTLHPVYRLVFFDERLLSPRGFSKLIGDGLKKGDRSILGDFDLIAQHDLSLIAIDVDGDGADEVLASGGGGAGGTGMLEVYKLDQDEVRMIYNDTSRFPMYFFRTGRHGPYSVANAGFDFVFDRNSIMHPKRFEVYAIKDGSYKKVRELEGRKFEAMLGKLEKRWGSPKGLQHVEIFDRRR